ncbi:MAG: ExbD/TolR family protein [Pseudanabaenaceae cyanobacterium]|jgi:biopolymer transport protein ExbD
MKLRSSKPSQNPEINVTALLDVVFSVLAFFVLLTSALTIPTQLGIDLPRLANGGNSSGSGSSGGQDAVLMITLDRFGRPLIDGQPVTDAQLEQQVNLFLRTSAQGLVILNAADASVTYQVVVERLAQLRRLAGDRVGIATNRS